MAGSSTPLVSFWVLAFNLARVGVAASKRGVKFPGSLSPSTTTLTIGAAARFVAFLGLKSICQSLDSYGECNQGGVLLRFRRLPLVGVDQFVISGYLALVASMSWLLEKRVPQ
jgi:hypothetical protein